MPNTYSDQTGLNTRRAIPTSRFGTRNLVWYQFYINYDLLRGEAPDGYMAYDSSSSFYHFIVETIQEAGELYHLGAPSILTDQSFMFAIADNDAREQDDGNSYAVAYGVEGDYTKSSVYQALVQRLDGESGWDLTLCFDAGFGIAAL